MSALFAASLVFFLFHMLPSTPLRPKLVAAVGEGAYMAAFSVLSLVAIWWLIHTFEAAPYGDKLWAVPDWWLWLKAALVLFALILALGGILTPNPSAPGAGKLLENSDLSKGIFAITRHPLMWGAAIWAIAHAISEATLRGFLFFGAFAATALIGSWLQQRRKRATLPGWAAFEAKTSFVPFMAILDGRSKLSVKAIGWWRIAVAAVAWALVMHFHTQIFGAQPLPVYV